MECATLAIVDGAAAEGILPCVLEPAAAATAFRCIGEVPVCSRCRSTNTASGAAARPSSSGCCSQALSTPRPGCRRLSGSSRSRNLTHVSADHTQAQQQKQCNDPTHNAGSSVSHDMNLTARVSALCSVINSSLMQASLPQPTTH